MTESISNYVGKKIKFYRKQNKLSLEQLSVLIHKNKSTLSKYENGVISIDVETLLDIAKALKINVTQLIDYNYSKDTPKKISTNPFNSEDLYIYYYDGRKKNIVYSYIKLHSHNNENNTIKASFYMDIPSFTEYEKCRFYYIGEMNAFYLVSYFTLLNQTNPMEHLGMCILNSFDLNQTTYTWGFMFGISYNPIAPFALKFLLSTRPLHNSEITLDKLTLTREELKTIKYYNMLLLNSNSF